MSVQMPKLHEAAQRRNRKVDLLQVSPDPCYTQ